MVKETKKTKEAKVEKQVKPQEPRTKLPDIVSREYTIHLSKRLFGVTFKNRAPRAVREIKAFATKALNTKSV